MGALEIVAGLCAAAVAVAGVRILRTYPAVRAGTVAAARRPAIVVPMVLGLGALLVVGMPYAYLESQGDPPPPLSFDDLPAVVTTAPFDPAAAADAAPADPDPDPAAADATAAPEAPDVAADAAPEPAALGGDTGPADPAPGEAPAPAGAPSPIEGTWAVGQGSEARYGIDDTILYQTSRVVGRTQAVSGSMQVVGSTITAVHVEVDMRTITCRCQHDGKYHDLLDTATYPTASFDLLEPITIDPLPPENQQIEVPAVGHLTLHGITHQVTITLAAMLQGGRIAVHGGIPVRLEDYDIERPDNGPFGSISNASMQILVAFDRTG